MNAHQRRIKCRIAGFPPKTKPVTLAIVHAQTAVVPPMTTEQIQQRIELLRSRAKAAEYPFEAFEMLNGHPVYVSLNAAGFVVFHVDGRRLAFSRIIEAVKGE